MQERAEAVRAYLVAMGVATDRLLAVGLGSGQPIAANETERGRSQNRRTEVHVLSME